MAIRPRSILLALAVGGVASLAYLAPHQGADSRGASNVPGLAAIGLVRSAAAQPAPAPAGDVIVARVGESTITARELERRMAEMPRNVLATMGSTPEEVRRAFLDQVLVPAALFAEEARARGLDKQRDIRDRKLSVLRQALVHELRKEAKADGVDEDDVKAFYQANADKFSAPKRIGIHRILVSSEAEANALLKDIGPTPDTKQWNDLAREKSLDKASRLRGGSLGLVAEDGTTGQAGEKVDPTLFNAAELVKDGEIVPTPVKEGDKWAVVWKRQTSRPAVRSLELEAPTIKANIADERLRKAVQDVLARLRSELLTELNPELCDMVTVTAAGDLERTKRPGVLPRSKRAAAAAPVEGPGGLR